MPNKSSDAPQRRRILLVTGGSRGIGAAVCRQAIEAGYDIALTWRSEQAAAEAIVAEARAKGRRAIAVQAEMSRREDIARLYETVDAKLGPLTHLVNNAGLIGPGSPLIEASDDTIAHCIDVNVTGAILVAREAARRMAKSRGGHGGAIVHLSSMAATLGAPGEFVWYAASKGAIDALTIGMSKEMGKDGIRVNAVAPGLIDTEIHASAGDPGRLDRMRGMIPVGREGTADEVASAILYLLSDDAAYVSGTILRVSGGR
ncbi:SDR family oxidoreductase [Acetobacteraceae bacterium H6797]|nr:SDR family oxidoreductase [Acetobacteraceae bacterium H6797]